MISVVTAMKLMPNVTGNDVAIAMQDAATLTEVYHAMCSQMRLMQALLPIHCADANALLDKLKPVGAVDSN